MAKKKQVGIRLNESTLFLASKARLAMGGMGRTNLIELAIFELARSEFLRDRITPEDWQEYDRLASIDEQRNELEIGE